MSSCIIRIKSVCEKRLEQCLTLGMYSLLALTILVGLHLQEDTLFKFFKFFNLPSPQFSHP